MQFRANRTPEVVDWEDLKFTLADSRGMLKLHNAAPLSPAAIRQVHESAQGWAAGIILLSEERKASFEGAASGGRVAQDVFDYFAGVVFRKLDASTRKLLLATSFLELISPVAAERTSGRVLDAMLLLLGARNFTFYIETIVLSLARIRMKSYFYYSHKEERMKQKAFWTMMLLLALGTLLFVACSGGGSSAPPQGTFQLGIQVTNSVQSPKSAPALRTSKTPSFGDFQPTSIASGPPQQFVVSIVKMELLSDGGAYRTIFDDPAGKPLDINGSVVDLSALFTNYACLDGSGNPVSLPGGQTCPCGLDANNTPVPLDPATGKCPVSVSSTPPAGKLLVDTGVYTSLRITYLRRAQIKGCVTGNFSTQSLYSGPHTYCTQSAFSTFNAAPGGQNSDFENKTAELMDFDLGSPFTTDTTQTIVMDYPIKDTISIGSDATAQLTLLFDVNRMLRFFNQGRTDAAPIPAMPTTSSYFFTTVFQNSEFAFVGLPGLIRGYSWITDACANATSIPADHVCTTTGGPVAGWLTLASAADGTPLLANFMPDDDNSLTVIKGANVGTNGLDPSLITKNADSTLTIKFTLGSDGNGTVYKFNPDIAVGATDGNSYFEGLQNSYGTLLFMRGL